MEELSNFKTHSTRHRASRLSGQTKKKEVST